MSTSIQSPDVAALQRIEADALRLSPDERAALAERLWASVEGSDVPDPAWEAEIRQRMQDVDSGAVQCRPWDDVMADLRAKHQG
jgi:putative addiction module component (TIGR02574 family)